MATTISARFQRTGDSFLLQDTDLRAGYRVVSSIAERDAIPIAARKPGMIVRVNTPEGYQDWELGHDKPISNAGWIEATLGGTKGNFIPVEGGDLTGVLKLGELGAIDFNGALKAQVFDENLQFTVTAEIGEDDPEPKGMMSFNDGTKNTIEINPMIGQMVCATEVGLSSDRSLKDDIQRIENSIEKTLRMYGYTFEKIGNGNRRFVGLIAQEVAQILPEAVTRTNDGKLAVFYGSLAGLFVENIHEIVGMLDRLDKRISELESK